MKRFLNFNKDGELFNSTDNVDNNSVWCYDNDQKYFVKGDRIAVLVEDKISKEFKVSLTPKSL